MDNNNKVNSINKNNSFDNNHVQIIKSISDLNEVLKQGNFDRGMNSYSYPGNIGAVRQGYH